jgi:hypothetical protein
MAAAAAKTTNELSLTQLNDLLNEAKQKAQKGAGRKLVIVIGNTGDGKSTSINLLAGRALIRKEVDDDWVLEADEPVVGIGHSLSVSHTLFSEVVEVPGKDFLLCDTPGFGDTRTDRAAKLCAGRGVQFAIEYAGAVQGILSVIDANSFSGSRSKVFREFVDNFLTIVGDPSKFKRLEIEATKQIKFLITKLTVSEGHTPRNDFFNKVTKLKKELVAARAREDDDSEEGKKLDQEIAVLELIETKTGVFFIRKDAKGFIPGRDDCVEGKVLAMALIDAFSVEGSIPKESLAIFSPRRGGIAKEALRTAATVQLENLVETINSDKDGKEGILSVLLTHLQSIAQYYLAAVAGTMSHKDIKSDLEKIISAWNPKQFASIDEGIALNLLIKSFEKLSALIKDLISEKEAEEINRIIGVLKVKVLDLNAKITTERTDSMIAQLASLVDLISNVKDKQTYQIIHLRELVEKLAELKIKNARDLSIRCEGLTKKEIAEVEVEISVKKERVARIRAALGSKPEDPGVFRIPRPADFLEPRPVVLPESYIATGKVTESDSGSAGEKQAGPDLGSVIGMSVEGIRCIGGEAVTMVRTGKEVKAFESVVSTVYTGSLKDAHLTALRTAGKLAKVSGGVNIAVAGVGVLGSVISWGLTKKDEADTREQRRKIIATQEQALEAWRKQYAEHAHSVREWEIAKAEHSAKYAQLREWEAKNLELDGVESEIGLLSKKRVGISVSYKDAEAALADFKKLYEAEEKQKQLEIEMLEKEIAITRAVDQLLVELSKIYEGREELTYNDLLAQLREKREQLQEYASYIRTLDVKLEILSQLNHFISLIELEAGELSQFMLGHKHSKGMYRTATSMGRYAGIGPITAIAAGGAGAGAGAGARY